MPGDRGTRTVVNAALVVAVSTGVSQVLGFVRDAVIAAVYGVGGAVDAFLVAQNVMNLVMALIAGAMAKATVPVVARAVEAGEARAGNTSARVGLTVAVLVLGAASVLMWFGAGPVIAVLAPGFDAATAALAVELTRILLVATVFVAGTNILAGVAQAHGVFVWSALQGVPFNLVMIGAALVFGPVLGVRALALGFVLGSLARLLLQLVPLRRIGLRLAPSLRLGDAGFREMSRMVPALLVGSAVTNINALVDRAVASTLGEGAITALSFAFRLVTLPDMIVIVALTTALYPAFGAVSRPERRDELRALVHRGAGAVLVLLVPFVAVMVVAADAVVVLVFGRGNFDDRAVALTSVAVVAYAAAILGMGLREVLARASYACGDAATPARIAVVAMIVNVAGDLTLGPIFGIAGIGAATTLSFLVAAALLCWRLHRRHDAVAPRYLARAALVIGGAGALAATGAGAAGWLVRRHLGDTLDAAQATVLLAVVTVVTVTIYLLGLRLAKAPELTAAQDVVTGLLRRFRRARA